VGRVRWVEVQASVGCKQLARDGHQGWLCKAQEEADKQEAVLCGCRLNMAMAEPAACFDALTRAAAAAAAAGMLK
jgi:hypothetical protein